MSVWRMPQHAMSINTSSARNSQPDRALTKLASEDVVTPELARQQLAPMLERATL
jgi:phospholipase/lecithinase/hemolysin